MANPACSDPVSVPHDFTGQRRLATFFELPFLSFLDVLSGADPAIAVSGSACVSRAVFGVPPNTFRLALFLNAAKPKNNPPGRVGKEAGRETRPTATGTVALHNHFGLARESPENVEEPLTTIVLMA